MCGKRKQVSRQKLSKFTCITHVEGPRLEFSKGRHTGYIEVFIQGKCGRDTETTFELKRRFGTHDNFEATS